MQAKRGQIESLQAGCAALRVKVDALLNASEAPKDVVEATLSELKTMGAEMKPLAAVATEFRGRWKKQKASLLEKRKAEVEHHLRQASSAQLSRMEAEADDQISTMNQDFDQRRRNSLDKIHRAHDQEFHRIVEDWLSEVRYADHVKPGMVDNAIAESIAKIKGWALKEEIRIMGIWESELSNMMLAVNNLDESEIQAMEDSRLTRCRMVESAVERQQQDLLDFRNFMQDQSVSFSKRIISRAQPDDSKQSSFSALSAKRAARPKQVAKREVEMASQLHVDAAIRYLDEAAALERARVSAYHTTMQEMGSDFTEQLQDGLMKETEAAASKAHSSWGAGAATASGLPSTFSTSRQHAGQTPATPSVPIGINEEDDATSAANQLAIEVNALREKARVMMAAVGRGDWRKDILEVAEGAIDGLRRTEMALAQGPLQHTAGRTTRNPKESLSTIESYARNFSDGVLKEFTRMRNVKVALSCSRSKHVREAMQQYEINSSDIEDAIMPAVSKLAHEVEVIREVITASKYGQEKMPIYVIAACWRRALLAAYPALKRLWEAADVPDVERKTFIRKIAMHIAVEPSIGPLFTAETSALEATLPAPDWAVAM